MTKKQTKKNNKRNNQRKPKTRVVYKTALPSIGAQIGDGLQKLGTSLFTKFMGSGDYTCNEGAYDVKSNALIKGSEAKAVKMSNNNSTFIVEHSEYITDIKASATVGAFKQDSFTVNPTNTRTFPWLANIANSFETYEVEGMIFRFVSSSGASVASTNTAIGTVMGTFAYDSLDAPFVSKQQMLQYDDTVSCRTSQNFICGVECDKSRIPTFSSKLFNGTPAAGSDPRLYNLGNFVIASQGAPAASTNLGELWVSYRIKFHMTKDTNNVEGSTLVYTAGLLATPFSSISYQEGSLPLVFDTTTNTWRITSATVGAVYWLVMQSTNPLAVTWTVLNPIVSGADLYGSMNSSLNSGYSSNQINTTSVYYGFSIRATSDVVEMSWPVTSGPAASYTSSLYISQLDNDITPSG